MAEQLYQKLSSTISMDPGERPARTAGRRTVSKKTRTTLPSPCVGKACLIRQRRGGASGWAYLACNQLAAVAACGSMPTVSAVHRQARSVSAVHHARSEYNSLTTVRCLSFTTKRLRNKAVDTVLSTHKAVPDTRMHTAHEATLHTTTNTPRSHCGVVAHSANYTNSTQRSRLIRGAGRPAPSLRLPQLAVGSRVGDDVLARRHEVLEPAVDVVLELKGEAAVGAELVAPCRQRSLKNDVF